MAERMAQTAGRAAPRWCVAGPSLRGAPSKEGSGTLSLPDTSPVISSHICFFRRKRPLQRTRSVQIFRARQALDLEIWLRASSTPRAERPSQEAVPRLVSRRAIPCWSTTATASVRRRPANCPEGKESWRHEHRPLAARFLVRGWCAFERHEGRSGPAQFPRAVVRPVPQGPPGRRAVDPRRVSRQAHRHRRGTRPAAALPSRRRARLHRGRSRRARTRPPFRTSFGD